MPDNNRNKGTNPLLVVAAIGAGVAAAVGSYFYGRQQGAEEERQETLRNRTHTVPTPRVNETDGASGGGEGLKKGSKRDDQGKECVICFRDFESIKENNEEIHTTPCGHLFCKHCIDDALSKKPECPYCRNHVEPHETLRVFV